MASYLLEPQLCLHLIYSTFFSLASSVPTVSTSSHLLEHFSHLFLAAADLTIALLLSLCSQLSLFPHGKHNT